jgi:alkylated DNA nucleotide flippase Atl1
MPIPFETPDLELALRQLINQIPAGKVSTCGMLAQALGSPFAAKWIGHFALHHQHDEACVCRRVVRQFLLGRRLPEPIYWADRLSKKPI